MSQPTNPLNPYYSGLRDELETQKKEDLADLSASRSLQRQEASINHELLKKYLPELNAANGLTGLGVSESFNLDSLSRYQNNLSDIERNYQSGRSELERAYGERLDEINAAERKEMKDNSTSEYDEAFTWIAAGYIDNEEDLNNFIDGFSYLDEDQKAKLKNYGMGIIDEKKATEEENTGSTTAYGTINSNTGTVKVPIGYKSVELYVAGETENSDAAAYANDEENGVENNGVFFYGNNLYYKSNGHVFELYDKNGSVTDKSYTIAYDYLKNGTIPEGYELDPKFLGSTFFPWNMDEISSTTTETPKEETPKEEKGTPNTVSYDGNPRKGITNFTYYDENGVEHRATLDRATLGYDLANTMQTSESDTVVKYGSDKYVRIGAVVYKIID